MTKMATLALVAVVLASCTGGGTGCITYGQFRADVPASPEFAILDTAMTEACVP